MSVSPKVSPLRNLVNILSDTVARVEEKFTSAGLEFPTLDKPFDGKDPAYQLLSSTDIVPLSSIIVAASEQMIASVRHPSQTVIGIAQSHMVAACLRLVCETSVAEILREAGPEGLHVDDIAAKNKMHPGKLVRVLRMLASHHIFIEVSPGVFTNSSLSSVLDTGNSVMDLFTQPRTEKFKQMKSSACAFVESTGDDTMKGAAFMTDILLDPATSHSEETSDAAYAKHFNSKGFFERIYENEYLTARFHIGMNGLGSLETVAPGGFPWETLPEGTKIVDVGGGVGTACQAIMKKNPFVKFTIQDLPKVIEEAIAYWNRNEPKAVAEGRVTFQGHNFFSPQPAKDADVFILRYILHDWSNAKAIEILKQLRGAAIPGKTKVLVEDGVIKYACAVNPKEIPGAEGIEFEGADKREVPAGLLPNLGKAEAINYYLDMGMMILLNGQERVLGDHLHIMKASGWKIQKIYSSSGRRSSHVLAVAV